jgi:surfeit locus 1 family protein
MTAATRQFQAEAIPTIVMLVLITVFCGLGIWQLDRADQKRSTAASLEIRRALEALPITDHLPDVEQLEFRTVITKGRFLSEKTILIENRKHRGKTGFHVITPLLTDTEQIVLVNRGWIPRPGQDAQPDIPQPAADVVVVGEVRLPQPPALELTLNIDQTEPTPHWPFLTLENYSTWSGLDIQPFLILQSPEDSSAFVRQWPQPKANDAMHIGYAVQWFAFALIILAIWLGLSIHKTVRTGTDEL